APSPASSQRYRVVWRWHFYAGLFVAPVLLVLAVTGSIYLFKEPFEAWRYQDVRTLAEPVTAPRPLSEQIAAAQSTLPGTPVMSVIPPTSPDRTTRVILQGSESGPFAEGISVYVDPATAQVVGRIDDSATFMRVVRTVHGELMSGTVGDRIVEIAACWALILVATGTYLWWSGRRTRTKPARSGRGRLRRVHIVTGVGGGAVVVFLVLSGLPWSGVWGDGLQRIQAGTGSTTPSADDYPNTSAPPLSGDLSDHPDAKVPWAAERLPVPPSGDEHAGHGRRAAARRPARRSRPHRRQAQDQAVPGRRVRRQGAASRRAARRLHDRDRPPPGPVGRADPPRRPVQRPRARLVRLGRVRRHGQGRRAGHRAARRPQVRHRQPGRHARRLPDPDHAGRHRDVDVVEAPPARPGRRSRPRHEPAHGVRRDGHHGAARPAVPAGGRHDGRGAAAGLAGAAPDPGGRARVRLTPLVSMRWSPR
ncbi:PepSY domain-containing protein, partial [Nonomuraea longispora]